MAASEAAVQVVVKGLHCAEVGTPPTGDPSYCLRHFENWIERGCPVAVAVADAVAAIAAREALEQAADALHYAEQGWDSRRGHIILIDETTAKTITSVEWLRARAEASR